MRRALSFGWALVAALEIAHGGWSEAAKVSARGSERALIIFQGGRTVLERYARGMDRTTAQNLYSMTKSVAALAILSAVAHGHLALDERASEIVPAWRSDPAKRQITIRELLNQTSGLATGYSLYEPGLKTKASAALKLPAVAPPGRVFAYGPAHYEALEAILRSSLNRPTMAWVEGSVLFPLGIAPSKWRRDGRGDPFFSAGMFLTPREMLSVGHLIRRKGWQWIFPIIPSGLIKQAETGSAANPMYGFGLWLNANATKREAVERDAEQALSGGLSREQWQVSCLSRAAPGDLVAMVGSGGQRVYVVPSKSVVIVRFGDEGGGFRDPEFLRALFR